MSKLFLISLSILVLFGLAMLSTASAVLSYKNFGDSYYYFRHQILNGLLPGIILFVIASRIPHARLKKLALPLMISSIFLMFLIFVPSLGFDVQGTARWLKIGGFSFQPSEIMKLSFVIYLAAFFESRKKEVTNFKEGFLPFAIVCGIVAILLVSQPDLGTLSVISFTALATYFSAGAKISHIFTIIIVGLVSLAVFIFGFGYELDRIKVYLNPDADKLGASYQVNQSKLAIKNGGIMGIGFGQSQKNTGVYLPEPMGDSVFAIVSEELGFAGVAFTIFLFLFITWQGLRTAKLTHDVFSKLLVTGIVSWIVIQAFVNIAAVSGVLPLTGLPLPFVSYGGTSLAILLTACGVVYNIQRGRH